MVRSGRGVVQHTAVQCIAPQRPNGNLAGQKARHIRRDILLNNTCYSATASRPWFARTPTLTPLSSKREATYIVDLQ